MRRDLGESLQSAGRQEYQEDGLMSDDITSAARGNGSAVESAAGDGAVTQEQTKDKTPVWMKNKKKQKVGKKPAKKQSNNKSNKAKQAVEESPKPDTERVGTQISGEENSAGVSGASDDSDSEGASDKPAASASRAVSAGSAGSADVSDDDAEWERCQSRVNKRSKALEGKSRVSHLVHAPQYSELKHEYWWVYVCDRRGRGLVTAPLQITDLVTSTEVELKFTAPRKPGLYTFTVCLRSDSYLGFDQSREFKLDVKEAHEIPVEHPQWDISDEDADKSDAESDVDEFATDDDVEESDSDE